MFALAPMEVVAGQDYSGVVLVTILYYLLVRSPLAQTALRASPQPAAGRLTDRGLGAARAGRRADDEPGVREGGSRSGEAQPLRLLRQGMGVRRPLLREYPPAPPASARWNVPLTAGAARQGNYNEQTAAFLGLMWLYAVFCDAVAAAEHGLVYVGFRHAHPTPPRPLRSALDLG